MDSLIKAEDFEFSTDSPMYDFSTGFDAIPLTYMPDSDSGSMYSYGSSPPSSSSSSPTHNMAVDNNFPPPPRLSNNHRQTRFINRAGWNMSDPHQRPSYGPGPRPYGSSNMYGAPYDRPVETMDTSKNDAPEVLQYPQTSFHLRSTGNRSMRTGMETNVAPAMMESLPTSPASSSSGVGVASSSSTINGAVSMEGDGPVQLVIESHPPVEVRTRTPSEKRNFSCSIQLVGDYKAIGGKFVSVELMYAPNAHRAPGEDEMPKQTILGGTKVVLIKANGSAVFDNLSMSEASTKHKEKEFCLKFTLVDKSGAKLPVAARSSSFYAFSNTKVLARRRDISLRTLSKTFGVFQGGESMHVIGAPFIRGPALKLIFRTPHGDAIATNLELYSETVLFFTLPAYPGLMPGESEPLEAKAQVLVTNDGRNFSNPLEFHYVSSRRSNMRSYL